METLNNGPLKVCNVVNSAAAGKMPHYTLSQLFRAYYADRTIGLSRMYAASGANRQCDRLVRCWKDSRAAVDMIAVIGTVQYRIDAIQYVEEEGLAFMDLTLAKVGDFYDIG